MRSAYPLVPIDELVSSVRKWNPYESTTNKLFTYIDIASINRETKQIEEAVEILTHDAPSRARQIVKAGDILISTVRPNLNAVAHLNSQFDGATASTGFTVLRTKPQKLDSRYLYYWVRTSYFIEDMVRRSTGASYPAVSDSIIKEYGIPLPPLEEQRRIAAILDKADAVRRKRQQAIRLTEELLRSAFLEMFGDPVTNPKGWEIMSLSDVADKNRYAIVDGPFGSSLKQEEYIEQGVPVIRINNIKPLAFHDADFKFITEQKFNELKRSSVMRKDILMARVGHTVGKACIFDQDYPALLSTTGVAKITCNTSIICPDFLVHQINLPQYQRYLTTHVGGAGQPYLNLTKIKALQLVVPPTSKQIHFVHLVSSQGRMRMNLLESQSAGTDIFNSLLQRAFRGEL